MGLQFTGIYRMDRIQIITRDRKDKTIHRDVQDMQDGTAIHRDAQDGQD